MKRINIFIFILGLVIFSIDSIAISHTSPKSDATRNILQQQIFPVKDGQLAYYRFGHGSPIVFITGFGATISEWNKTFLETLAKSHEVIVFDNRGVGNSHFSTPQYRIPDLANDTDQLIKGLNLSKPTILGWSMGGMIAQELAVQHPQTVGKLVLMSTAIEGKNAVPTSLSVWKKLTNTSGNEAEKFNRILSILFPANDVPVMSKNFLQNMFKPQGKPEPLPPAEVIKKQKIILLKWIKSNNISKKLYYLKIPTLILAGTEDVIILPENATILARTIPNAQVRMIKGGGHAMMYQYPIEIANIITSFIDDKSQNQFP